MRCVSCWRKAASGHQHLSGRRGGEPGALYPLAGRVGLFNNQAGDRLLHLADLIICIGYSPVEYEPSMWNSGDATLVHIDVLPAYEERNYVPDLELVGISPER
jgi:thiamine pyrophosphate-dependent acetolactate synthase large subunit-like protein